MALAVQMMEEYLGRKFRAVMSLEIGGGNSIQPFMAAALTGPARSSTPTAWGARSPRRR